MTPNPTNEELQQIGEANAALAAFLVGTLIGSEADHFFVAPGSRCTPLTLAIANHPSATAHRHFDERGLAFLALGWAKANRHTGRVPVLVCTSGTALANFMPAVVEARETHTPLLLLTADRPPELRGTGANQTINQPEFYGRQVLDFLELPCPDATGWGEPNTLLNTLRVSLAHARSGPVHWNAGFRKPLEHVAPPYRPAAPDHLKSQIPAISNPPPSTLPTLPELPHRAVIVAGTNADSDFVTELRAKTGWPLVADITSGLRGRPDLSGPEVIAETDTLVHVGGRIVSRIPFAGRVIQIQQRDRRSIVPEWWTEASIERVDPTALLARLAAPTAIEPTEKPPETSVRPPDTLNELAVAKVIAETIPDGHRLFLGNSLPVRLMDRVGYWPGRTIHVGTNRGASGIDGLIASAAGFCLPAPNQTGTLLIGDLSLLHDLNSLALAQRLVIVVLNNDGGAIFGLLPIRNRPEFHAWFTTPHGFRFESAAAQFGLHYVRPTSLAAFKNAFRDATPGTLIEVPCDREETIRLLTRSP